MMEGNQNVLCENVAFIEQDNMISICHYMEQRVGNHIALYIEQVAFQHPLKLGLYELEIILNNLTIKPTMGN